MRRYLTIVTVVVALITGVLPVVAGAAPAWSPEATATIHPGVQTFTAGAQCTANFVFTGTNGAVYIGQAAHCSGLDGSTATDGCISGSLPLGTQVEVDGAQYAGTMVYNSWLAMQSVGEEDANACAYNDFALVLLDPRDHARVNPTMPCYGGPVGTVPVTQFGDDVFSYGNSGLRGGVSATSPKRGTSLGQSGAGWTHRVYTESPGIPGDSGSGFLNVEGRAFGVLSTVTIFPTAGSNGVSDLTLALAYVDRHTGFDIDLALGTRRFTTSCASPGSAPTSENVVRRLSGASRVETAVAISQDDFADGLAGGVVLARADVFADALAATPLAVDLAAPLLLTDPTSLHPATRNEIQRVLARGRTVTVLGGPNAISGAVVRDLEGAGYTVRRLAGPSRIETAIAVAEAVTASPAQILLADGNRFQDALVSGPAAASVGGVVVLTDGNRAHAAVDAYLAKRANAEVVTVGDVATRAYPGRRSYVGTDDADTSVRVAGAYLSGAAVVGVARRDVFADALAGGAHAGRRGAPVLLSDSSRLPAVVRTYLEDRAATVSEGVLYGGPNALSQQVADDVYAAIT